MRNALLCLCLTPLLAACQDRSEPVEPGRARDEQTGTPAQTPAAALDETPDFVGVWAARADQCPDRPWMFTAQGVRTAGEVSCAWTKVEKTATGHALAGTCTAEGPATPAEVTLTADPADPRAMTVSGGPWARPIALVRCDATADAG